jgi:hypothetical protein
MSSQVPVVVVGSADLSALESRLAEFGAFPIVNSKWDAAAAAVAKVRPGAVIADVEGVEPAALDELAAACEAMQPYTPLIAIGEASELPPNALPFSLADLDIKRLGARLSAALRVRTLHETVLRRLADGTVQIPEGDPMKDATVLLVGRGRAYPPLSVALGERVMVIGALTIEAAARHLNAREIDGIVLGDGFSHRIAQAFLTVLSENARFRSLPIIVAGSFAGGAIPELANLEIVRGTPEQVLGHAAPLIRQRAFEARLTRTMDALEAGGLIDPATGLLTSEAFDRDWSKAVTDAVENGASLSAARFAFVGADARAQRDAARILGGLLRGTDFASLQGEAIVKAFAATDLRSAHVIARRLASVLRQTSFGPARKLDPAVTIATVKSDDTPESVFRRLQDGRAAP